MNEYDEDVIEIGDVVEYEIYVHTGDNMIGYGKVYRIKDNDVHIHGAGINWNASNNTHLVNKHGPYLSNYDTIRPISNVRKLGIEEFL